MMRNERILCRQCEIYYMKWCRELFHFTPGENSNKSWMRTETSKAREKKNENVIRWKITEMRKISFVTNRCSCLDGDRQNVHVINGLSNNLPVRQMPNKIIFSNFIIASIQPMDLWWRAILFTERSASASQNKWIEWMNEDAQRSNETNKIFRPKKIN